MELAAAEQRILVTLDSADFPRIARKWLETGTPHHGCAVIVSLRHHEFGAILRALDAAFQTRPDAEDWRDRLVFVSRSR